MRIKFQKITIHNFLSYGDAALDLADRGYTLLCGTNHNVVDNARSNGSGKSAIWCALSWCLTGETIRGIKTNLVNIHTTGGAFATVKFQIDNTSFEVTRYKDHEQFGSSLKIFVNGVDRSGKGLRDSEAILASYLPEELPKLLGAVIILGQGLPQRFSNNTPSGRKAVLESLSQSDFMLLDIKNRLSNRLNELNKRLRELQDEQLVCSTNKAAAENEVNRVTAELEGLPSIEEVQSAIDELTKDAEILHNRLNSQKEAAETFKQQKERLNESLQITTGKVTEITNLYREKAHKVETEKAVVSATIRNLEKELERLSNIKEFCPTCGQRLPDAHKPDTSEQEAQLREAKEKLYSLAQEVININKQCTEEICKFDDRNSLADAFGRIKRQLEDQEELIRCTENEYNKLASEKAWQEMLLSTRNETAKKRQARLVELKQLLEEMSNRLGYNKEEESIVQDRIAIVNKMVTLSNRDFRGRLLANVINYINKKAKEYSMDIFGTDRVSFELNGNDIDISYDGKLYENLSGGEKQRLDIIVQFALRDMLVQFSGFSSNIICLDEIFDGLDATGIQSVLDTIAKRLSDVESIFIITHHQDIPVPCDTLIQIEKDEQGISRIR